MIPDNEVALGAALDFLEPDDRTPGLLHDYEMGGLALDDASEDLTYQEWLCYLDTDGQTVRVRPVSGSGDGTSILVQPGITRLSFALDVDMKPSLAYVTTGADVFFRWYNPTMSAYETLTVAGARTPRVCWDDKRPANIANGDILLAYLRDDNLCYRQRRGLYTTEHVLASGLPTMARLVNVGMTYENRLQFQLAMP